MLDPKYMYKALRNPRLGTGINSDYVASLNLTLRVSKHKSVFYVCLSMKDWSLILISL